MRKPNPDPWIDAQLRGVTVPGGLAPRLREVALDDEAALDGQLRGVPVPSGLTGRLRGAPAADDAGLDALLRNVPVPYRVVVRLRATPGYRLKLRRIAGWVAAASLMAAIGLSYFGAAIGLLIASLPPAPEPQPELAWHVDGELLSGAAETSLNIVQLPARSDSRSAAEASVAGPTVELPEPPSPSSLLAPSPPRRPSLLDDFALLGGGLPGGADPLLDVMLYRWRPFGAHEPFDEPPGWQEAQALRPKGIAAPTATGFDSSILIRYGVFPFVPTAADASLRKVSVPLHGGTDSFELTRRSVAEGRLPPPQQIRTEEFLAAVDYDLPKPNGRALRLSLFGGPSPFVPGRFVLQGGVQAAEVAPVPRPPVHLILAADATAGAHWPQRLSMLRGAVADLCRWLEPDDRLSLVAFHRTAEVLAAHAGPGDAERLQAALGRISNQDTTNPGAGLAAAYSLAYGSGESSRKAKPVVVLLTKGLPDLPLNEAARIEQHLAEAAREGINLHVVDTRSMPDSLNLQLGGFAEAGGGRLWNADDPRRFTRTLREAITGQPQVVAESVRFAVRFDPKAVGFYRLLGHEPGAKTMETVSALHSGQSSTVLFDAGLRQGLSAGDVLATAELSWREPGTGSLQRETVVLRHGDLPATWIEAPPPWQAALAVAEAGELLRGSVYTQLRPRPGTLAAMADLLEQLDTEVWQEPSFRDFAEVVRGAIKARPYRGGAAR